MISLVAWCSSSTHNALVVLMSFNMFGINGNSLIHLILGKGYTTFLIIIQLYMIGVEGGREEVGEKKKERTSPLNICIIPAILSTLHQDRSQPMLLIRCLHFSHDFHGVSILPHVVLIMYFSYNMAPK